MPFCFNTVTAASEVRNFTNALAASGSLAFGRHARHVDDDLLQIARQRTDDIDAGNRKQFGDLLHADLGFARRHRRADRLALDDDGLGPQRVCELEARDRGDEMPAARILAVGDGLCRNERGLEGVGGADVRLRRAGTHRDAHPREHDLGAVGDIAALDEIPDHVFIRDDEVEAGALLELA